MSPKADAQKFVRRRSDLVTLETLDLRVTALEDGMEDFRMQMGNAVSEIQANTALTEQIHGDVAGMVGFVKEMIALWERIKSRMATTRRRSIATAKFITIIGTAIITMGALLRMFGWW